MTETPSQPADLTDKWAALAREFPLDQIEKLPKQVSKQDTQKSKCVRGSQVSADGYACNGYHAKSIHLDYIGHAGITMRLNEVDPTWSWEPMSLTETGTPLFSDGGMWIRLTVLGVTRIGFGDAGGKSPGPNAVKEIIGDALRNGAMRFGVGTYLWSKSEAAERMKLSAAESEPQQHKPVSNWGRLGQAAQAAGLNEAQVKEIAVGVIETDRIDNLSTDDTDALIAAINKTKGNN